MRTKQLILLLVVLSAVTAGCSHNSSGQAVHGVPGYVPTKQEQIDKIKAAPIPAAAKQQMLKRLGA